jgi:hypothetical protein
MIENTGLLQLPGEIKLGGGAFRVGDIGIEIKGIVGMGKNRCSGS